MFSAVETYRRQRRSLFDLCYTRHSVFEIKSYVLIDESVLQCTSRVLEENKSLGLSVLPLREENMKTD